MNDASILRSEIERIDFANLANLIRTKGDLMDSAVITRDGVEHSIHRQITHTVTDRRRRVVQTFTIQLVEEPLGGAEGLGEV